MVLKITRSLALAIIFLFLVKVQYAQKQYSKNSRIKKTITSVERLPSINGIPASYFMDHPGVDDLAKKLYNGEIAIDNDSVTYSILDKTLVCNSEVRPFYFFLFNKIVEKSDDSMKIEVSNRCLRFIEQYPCDFFQFLNHPDFEVNIVKWTTYVGASLSGGNKFIMFRTKYDPIIKSSCSGLYDLWKSFAAEVRMCLVR